LGNVMRAKVKGGGEGVGVRPLSQINFKVNLKEGLLSIQAGRFSIRGKSPLNLDWRGRKNVQGRNNNRPNVD